MTMQRTHVSVRHDARADTTGPAASSRVAPVTTDSSVTEWTADLCHVAVDVPVTMGASLDYVDFDVVGSVHESPAAAGRLR